MAKDLAEVLADPIGNGVLGLPAMALTPSGREHLASAAAEISHHAKDVFIDPIGHGALGIPAMELTASGRERLSSSVAEAVNEAHADPIGHGALGPVGMLLSRGHRAQVSDAVNRAVDAIDGKLLGMDYGPVKILGTMAMTVPTLVAYGLSGDNVSQHSAPLATPPGVSQTAKPAVKSMPVR